MRQSQELVRLGDVAEILDALGGIPAVQSMTGLATPQAVWVWKDRGQIPSRYYLLMMSELERAGKTADPGLWGMKQREGGDVDVLH